MNNTLRMCDASRIVNNMGVEYSDVNHIEIHKANAALFELRSDTIPVLEDSAKRINESFSVLAADMKPEINGPIRIYRAPDVPPTNLFGLSIELVRTEDLARSSNKQMDKKVEGFSVTAKTTFSNASPQFTEIDNHGNAISGLLGLEDSDIQLPEYSYSKSGCEFKAYKSAESLRNTHKKIYQGQLAAALVLGALVDLVAVHTGINAPSAIHPPSAMMYEKWQEQDGSLAIADHRTQALLNYALVEGNNSIRSYLQTLHIPNIS